MSRDWWQWVGYAMILVIIGAGHVVWFDAVRDPKIGMRFGAALTCLGIVITALPYFRAGLRETVNRQLPAGLLDAISPSPPSQPVSDYSTLQRLRRKQAEHKSMRPGIVHGVVAERIIGVGLIILGTLIHGYGDLPLQWLIEP
jgi:hypothetical protein